MVESSKDGAVLFARSPYVRWLRYWTILPRGFYRLFSNRVEKMLTVVF